jgi:hypothetical protein
MYDGYMSNFDMIRAKKKQLDSDADVKCATIQFHDNSYNFQSDRWIELKFYMKSLDIYSYLKLKV